MADFVLLVGGRSAQGVRANNEDRFGVDLDQSLFLVADGMGGQERGELASGMAAEILPQMVHDHLAAKEPADLALRKRLPAINIFPDFAQNGGLIKALRSDSEASKIVSSVDVADLPSGQMTVVFALVEQASGKAGHYGAIDAKNGVAPSAVQTKDN